MGWNGGHLHEFDIFGTSYGNPADLMDGSVLDEKKVKLSQLISDEKEKFSYLYDFGDYQEHEITIEKRIEGKTLLNPVCLEAEGRCPPEDIGGTDGFEEFLNIMKDKSHPERKSYIEWYGSEFDPSEVDLDQINKDLANLHQYILEIEDPQD